MKRTRYTLEISNATVSAQIISFLYPIPLPTPPPPPPPPQDFLNMHNFASGNGHATQIRRQNLKETVDLAIPRPCSQLYMQSWEWACMYESRYSGCILCVAFWTCLVCPLLEKKN